MFIDHQQLKTLGLGQFEAVTAATNSTVKSLLAVTTEAADYTKRSIESSLALREKLMHARKFDEIVQHQSDFAKTTFDEFIARATRIGTVYADLARENFRAIEVGLSARSSEGASARKQDVTAA